MSQTFANTGSLDSIMWQSRPATVAQDQMASRRQTLKPATKTMLATWGVWVVRNVVVHENLPLGDSARNAARGHWRII